MTNLIKDLAASGMLGLASVPVGFAVLAVVMWYLPRMNETRD